MIDLSRAPSRPGPRFARWVTFAVLWAASFAILVLIYSLLAQPLATVRGVPTTGAEEAYLALAVLGLPAGLTFSYASMRLRKGGSVWSNSLLALGYPVGDPDTGRRSSDPEERAAWSRFKRGQIGRVDYERLMVRRRFVHGEVAAEEYHQIMRELTLASEGAPPKPSVRANPPTER